MSSSIKIVWSATSVAHFANWIRYIARDSRQNAERERKILLRLVGCLRRFPRSGRLVPEFDNLALREIIHGAIRVIYRIAGKDIRLLTFHHSSRPLDEELFR